MTAMVAVSRFCLLISQSTFLLIILSVLNPIIDAARISSSSEVAPYSEQEYLRTTNDQLGGHSFDIAAYDANVMSRRWNIPCVILGWDNGKGGMVKKFAFRIGDNVLEYEQFAEFFDSSHKEKRRVELKPGCQVELWQYKDFSGHEFVLSTSGVHFLSDDIIFEMIRVKEGYCLNPGAYCGAEEGRFCCVGLGCEDTLLGKRCQNAPTSECGSGYEPITEDSEDLNELESTTAIEVFDAAASATHAISTIYDCSQECSRRMDCDSFTWNDDEHICKIFKGYAGEWKDENLNSCVKEGGVDVTGTRHCVEAFEHTGFTGWREGFSPREYDLRKYKAGLRDNAMNSIRTSTNCAAVIFEKGGREGVSYTLQPNTEISDLEDLGYEPSSISHMIIYPSLNIRQDYFNSTTNGQAEELLMARYTKEKAGDGQGIETIDFKRVEYKDNLVVVEFTYEWKNVESCIIQEQVMYDSNKLVKDPFPVEHSIAVDECCKACREHPGECKAWTLHTATSICRLIKEDNVWNIKIQKNAIYVSGVPKDPCSDNPNEPCLMQSHWRYGHPFINHGGAYSRSNAVSCCQLCRHTNKCTGFVYHPDSHECWMKDQIQILQEWAPQEDVEVGEDMVPVAGRALPACDGGVGEARAILEFTVKGWHVQPFGFLILKDESS
eukprot:GHVL01018059.1.p1 GENE.GHVL01018059.1~~GHVL01018059.1.p1  ORF type:complete len:664 (+),score=115.40 GHVL01018059.1:99-2090(+)